MHWELVRAWLVAGLSWLVLVSDAHGREAVLESLSVVTDPPRPESPWAVRVHLSNGESSPAQGYLVFRVQNRSGRPLLEFETSALAVGADAWRRLIWLPPWLRGDRGPLRLSLYWRSEAGAERHLATQDLRRTDDHLYSTFTLTGSEMKSVGERELLGQVRLTKVLGMSGPFAAANCQEHLTRLASSEFPVSPASFCAFDMVVVTTETFKSLGERQLNALRRWVAAGGRLVVCPFDVPLEAEQIAFLNALAENDEMASPFRIDVATGCLAPYDRPYSRHAHGLGRAVIVAEMPDWEKPSAMRSWLRALSFLWRATLLEVDPSFNDPRYVERYQQLTERMSIRRYVSIVEPSDDFQLEWLRREGPSFQVEPIPLSWMLLSAMSFLVVIGPLERRLSRKLKRRYLVWVIFPLVTVAYAQFNMYLSDWHFSGQPTEKIIHLIDLDERGLVLRQSRFRMTMPEKEQARSLDGRHAILSKIPHSPDAAPEGSESMRWTGQFPQNYSLSVRERRWTPGHVREFSIPASDMPPRHSGLTKIDWQLFDGAWDEAAKAQFLTSLRAVVGEESQLLNERDAFTEASIEGTVGRAVYRPLVLAPRGGASAADLMVEASGDGREPATIAFQIIEGDEVFIYRRTDPRWDGSKEKS